MKQPIPTKEQLAVLNPSERRAYRIAHFMTRYLKWVGIAWNLVFMRFLIWFCVGRRVEFIGTEHLKNINSKSRLMLVANHRSFFDFFSIGYWFLISWNVPRKMFFPVRANFFYESFLGVIVTAMMGAWAMFPPIFRDPKKRIFNRYAIKRVIYEFQKSPSLIGFHPEGKRNKSEDPYSFLEARAGIGHVMVEVEDAIVMPLFIYGLTNSFGTEIKRNWGANRKKYPIHLMFGPPIDMQKFRSMPDDANRSQEIAEECMKAIRALAVEHKQKYNPEM